MAKLLPFYCLLILGIISALGQKDSTGIVFDKGPLEIQEIMDEDLLAYRSDPDFNYEVIKSEPTWWDNFLTWLWNLLLRFFEWLFGVEKAAGFLAEFFSWIPYILLGLLLFLLIRFFINVNARSLLYSKKNQSLITLSEEERIIKNEDIQQLIQNALQQKDYRLAIRYYYLYILKILSEAEIIDWQLQKTNADYISEIEEPELKQPFGHVTRLYDYIWYGGFHIDEGRYTRFETTFASLKKRILENG
ncbi:DUF4129 domain-containing protein [Ulvibacterium sp.]|uniref:DUF4129 domain-containing protein n=1 Tax=Ulvibacterium sp. TaxID=2665914 RepID=UPI00260F846B|nr:DUF4129 domain-containing protein [Ulvibacterium sp.]